MREVVQNAIDALSALVQDIEELAGVNKDLEGAKVQLESLAKQHDEVEAKLKDKTLLLDKAQHETLKNHNAAVFAAAEKITSLSYQISALDKALDEKKTALSDIQTLHKQVEASLQVLRTKLG